MFAVTLRIMLLVTIAVAAFAGRADADTPNITFKIPEDADLGATPFVFRKISETRSDKLFCNSDVALHQMLGLPNADADVGTCL